MRLHIIPDRVRGQCEIDRGFDPDKACLFVRRNPLEPRTLNLPATAEARPCREAGRHDWRRDVWNRRQRRRIQARIVSAPTNLRETSSTPTTSAAIRVLLLPSGRESRLPARMESFVRNHHLAPYRRVVDVLAEELESKREMSAEQISRFFERHALPFNEVPDGLFP